VPFDDINDAQRPVPRRRETLIDIDIGQAAPGRVYDHFLGGAHTFAADRDLANHLTATVPDVARMAWTNRAFLHRALSFLVQFRVQQFLDLGCGLLTVGSVHDLLQEVAPPARVVHIDLDAVTVAHASHAILTDGRADRAVAVCADVRYPWTILNHRDVQRLLDFQQPIAILAAAVLHYLSDNDKPLAVLTEYRDATVAGSYLAISHLTADSRPTDVTNMAAVAARFGNRITPRPRSHIQAMFAGFEPVDPGLVWAPAWRPDRTGDADIEDTNEPDPSRSCVLAGIGRKPGPPIEPPTRRVKRENPLSMACSTGTRSPTTTGPMAFPNRTPTPTAFLRSQAQAIIAADFFEASTLSGARLYMLAIIEHATRRVRILGATAHPTAAWVAQVARNLAMDIQDAGCQVKYLIRDRDGKYPALFDAILADTCITIVLSGVQIPRMNSIMERWIQTCRHELLDRTLIWNQAHLHGRSKIVCGSRSFLDHLSWGHALWVGGVSAR